MQQQLLQNGMTISKYRAMTGYLRIYVVILSQGRLERDIYEKHLMKKIIDAKSPGGNQQ
jgi:hypothetical protein